MHMVGRDRELARVTRLLDHAVTGRGHLVLCTGEAGIGKTRLAEETAALAAARGVPVAWARAADRGGSPPYGLWRMVLDDPAVRAADDEASGSDRWSGVFGDAGRPAVAEGADSVSARRFALFAEVRRRLAAAAGPSGLVLVLDDLQWADEASAAAADRRGAADTRNADPGVRDLPGLGDIRRGEHRAPAGPVGGRQHRAGGSAWPARRCGRGHVARRRARGSGGPGGRGPLRNGRQSVPGQGAGPHAGPAERGGIGAGASGRGDRLPARATVWSRPGGAAGRRGGGQQLLGGRGGPDAGCARAYPARPAGRVPGGRVPGGR